MQARAVQMTPEARGGGTKRATNPGARRREGVSSSPPWSARVQSAAYHRARAGRAGICEQAQARVRLATSRWASALWVEKSRDTSAVLGRSLAPP